MRIKKVGLLGESPNDTLAISHLLSRKYQGVKFQSALRNLTADDLMTPKCLRMISDLWFDKEYEFLIFIKDLDGFENDKTKREPIEKRFKEIQNAYPKQNLLLINIHEIESLILADIKSFDKSLSFDKDPMKVSSPKEFLQRELKKAKLNKFYKETDAPEVFKKIRS